MKKYITIIILILFNFSAFAKSGKIIVTGQIKNNSIKKISITFLNDRELVASNVDKKGVFKMSTKIESGYYFLKYGRNTSLIFLYPKDKISLNFDADDFTNTLVFNGVGALRNNYLKEKTIVGNKLTKDLNSFYKVDETKYLENIQNKKETHLQLLKQFDVSDYFKKTEIKSLEYERLLSINNFESNYKFYIGDEISTSKKFKNPIKNLDFNNPEDYKNQPYYRYLVNSYWSKKMEKTNNVEEMINVLKQVPSQDIAITLVNSCFSKISSNKDKAKDYLDFIKRITTNKQFIDAAEKQYKKAINSSKLTKGNVSPTFSYENQKGELINLKDLKGKYIYIDVWATWCGPCIKQIPYLKKLEKRYHNKNIVFVSISVDKVKMKKTWKQFIAKKGLGGIQLFADKSFDSDFMNAYAVNSIPRFILIDPEGNIIDAKAPRPSFDKTIQLLDKFLNSKK